MVFTCYAPLRIACEGGVCRSFRPPVNCRFRVRALPVLKQMEPAWKPLGEEAYAWAIGGSPGPLLLRPGTTMISD